MFCFERLVGVMNRVTFDGYRWPGSEEEES